MTVCAFRSVMAFAFKICSEIGSAFNSVGTFVAVADIASAYRPNDVSEALNASILTASSLAAWDKSVVERVSWAPAFKVAQSRPPATKRTIGVNWVFMGQSERR